MATTGGFLIEIDGTVLTDEVSPLLVSAYVDSSLRLPDAFALRFRDVDRTVIGRTGVKIGAKVKISVTTDANPAAELLVSGEVTALEAEFENSGTFTTIRGYDQSHRLFRGRHTASYTQATASDAVSQVARRAGLAPGRITASPTVFDHISQCAETDWEFLDALAREIGFEITVRDDKLDFGPPEHAESAPLGDEANPLVLQFGTDMLRLRSVITAAGQVGKVEMRGWDLAAKRPIVGTAEAGTRSAQISGISPADLAATFGDPTFVGIDTAYRTQVEADSAAKAWSERIGGAFAEVEAVARGNPKLRANACVSLENLGAPFDGKFLITSARHRYEPTAGYTTSFAVSGRHDRGLYGLVSGDSAGRSGRGLAIAQVTDVNDPEGSGRVKLMFPWMSDDYVSDWARTVQAGAGKDRGAMVLPEVGDEVLVAFEQDSPERPYVLGGLFNGVDTPNAQGTGLIDTGSGAVNRRSFISRIGHRIDLLDEDARTEGVAISSADRKLLLQLDAVGTAITVHSDGTVLVEGKKGVVVDAGTAPLELRGNRIDLEAKNGVAISGGSGRVEIDSASGVTVRGATVKVDASATADLQSGGPCSIKGMPVKLN